MAADLSPEILKEIDALISKCLRVREQFRRHGTPATSKVCAPVLQSAALFPDGTFEHNPVSDLEPYGKNLLRMQTEVIWAFSSGTPTEDLDCPQRAADFYLYFTQDLCNNWYYSTEKQQSEFASLYRDITNDEANRSLITQDSIPREGNTNSPRAAIAASAFILTNPMTFDRKIRDKAEKQWVDRCGGFITYKN
jgi:hypothetical protein